MGRRIAVIQALVGLVCWLSPLTGVAWAATCEGKPPLPPDGLVWPAAGGITQGWGFDCASGRGHRGIDINAPGGSQIEACAAGVVIFAGYTPAEGGGTTISIEHPGGLRSTYLHLSQALVSAGEPVTQKQAIGLSAGPYMHFGLKVTAPRELYFNPLLYLPGAAPSGGSSAPAAEAAPVVDPQSEPALPGAEATPVPAPRSEPAMPGALDQSASGQPAIKPSGQKAAAAPELEAQTGAQALAPRAAQGAAPGLPVNPGDSSAGGVSSLESRSDGALVVNPASAGIEPFPGFSGLSWASPPDADPPDGGAAGAQLISKLPVAASPVDGFGEANARPLESFGWESQRSGPVRGLINTVGALLLLGMAVIAAKATKGRTRPAALNIS